MNAETLVKAVGLVTRAERSGRGFFRLTLHAPEVARKVQPGQFVMVAVHPLVAAEAENLVARWDPLLRRPFSICRADANRGEIALMGETRGRGSALLAAALPGQRYSLLGPLGRPFRLERARRRLLLVGGGMGVAPLLFAGERFAAGGHEVSVLFGYRTQSAVVGWEETAAWAAGRYLATEDGSAGEKGLVSDVLRRLLAERGKVDAILACGPPGMLAAVTGVAREARVHCLVSLERAMGCGFGVCLSCAVARPDGTYALVCTDGPVFAAEEVDLTV